MKKLLVTLLLPALVLVSCSQQRFAHLKKVRVEPNEVATLKSEVKPLNKKEAVTFLDQNDIQLSTPELVQPKTENSIHEILTGKHEISGSKAQVEKPATPNKAEVKLAKKLKKLEQKLDKKGVNSDADTLVLVILSLFPILALIAIYIKDGKRITTNFWVDLLLHFLIIGYAIFAILVVLDIVNLA